MSTTTLQDDIDLLIDWDAETFTLTTGQLGSANIDALLQAQFDDETLLFSNETLLISSGSSADTALTLDQQGELTIVSGITSFLSMDDLPAVASFRVGGGQTELTLRLTLPSGWTLPDSFPSLQGTFIENVEFDDQAYVLESEGYDGQTSSSSWQPGLNFDAGLLGGSALDQFAWLLNDFQDLRASGPLVIEQDLPCLNLSTTVADKVALAYFQVGIELRLTTEVIDAEDGEEEPFLWSGAGLLANIDYASSGEEIVIPVSATFLEGQRGLISLVADLTDLSVTALDDLSVLLQDNDLGALVPSGYTFGDILQVTQMRLTIAPGLMHVSDVSVVILSPETWSLFPGFPALSNLEATFTLSMPLQNETELFCTVTGTLAFDDVEMDVSLSLPDLIASATLADGSGINLSSIIEYVAPGTTDLADLTISKLNFYGNATDGNYLFEIAIDSDWQLDFETMSLAISSARLSIEYAPDDQEGTQLQIGGMMTIADVDVYTSATYLGANNGWQFEGSTGDDQDIDLGSLLTELAGLFGVDDALPAPLAGLSVKNLSVSFNTKTQDFTFTCEADFPLGDDTVAIVVDIDISHQGVGVYTKTFGGRITVDSLEFDLLFSQNATDTLFVAAYHNADGDTLKVKDLIATVSADVADYVPDGLEVTLIDALFAYQKNGSAPGYLFGLDMGSGIDLSNLPLVGQQFPADASARLEYQILVASADFEQAEVDTLNGLLPDGVTPLPTSQDETIKPITAGLALATKMMFGDETLEMTLPVEVNDSGELADTTPSDEPPAPSGDNVAASDSGSWYTLQKTIGPVYFERVGVQYQDEMLWFLLDASLTAAGLTLSLDGLAVGSPLTEFSPQFKLDGLGVDYQGGPVEIGGAFLRTVGTDGAADDYSGKAVISTEDFTLSALGSYATLDGSPSLFVYAVLDYPLGGPSFFFVTGLAAGFGYNRALIMPTLDEVADFPLVAEAVGSLAPSTDLTAELTRLSDYIPPSLGESFLAVGVKFTSFKLIDSFVLLTAVFGDRFELDVLGLSTLIVPTPVPGQSTTPLAEVQLALRATFIPDEGVLAVDGQLTSESFILSRDCHLTGGFAFYSWFTGEHQGDFVQTIGGYHPDFKAPSHYPTVPRLAFNWKVDKHLTLKGDAYYALTPTTMMAGGSLDATWESGDIEASFNAGADFLISWQPYHYDATFHVSMGVKYTYWFFGTHHLNVDVGADLHVWGPEFAGKAHIKLSVVSFDVEFGSGSSKDAKSISWSKFRDAFLPESDGDMVGISAKDGLVTTIPEDDATLPERWIINPKHFSLLTNTVIPSNRTTLDGRDFDRCYYKDSRYTEPQPYVPDYFKEYSASNRDDLTAFLEKYGILYDETATDDELRQQVTEYIDDKLQHDKAIVRFGVAPMKVTSSDAFLISTHSITVTRDNVAVNDDFQYAPVLKNVPAGLWGNTFSPGPNDKAFVRDTLAGFELTPAAQPAPGETHDVERANLQYATTPLPGAYGWQTLAPFDEDDSLASDDEKEAENNRETRITETVMAQSQIDARTSLLQSLGAGGFTIDLSHLTTDITDAFLYAPLVGDLETV